MPRRNRSPVSLRRVSFRAKVHIYSRFGIPFRVWIGVFTVSAGSRGCPGHVALPAGKSKTTTYRTGVPFRKSLPESGRTARMRSRPALLLGVLRREDHVHLLAVELGHHLHLGELFEVGGEAQQQNLALLLEDDRTAAEEDVSLDLGALFKKVLSVFELEVVVVIVGRNESP